MALFTPTRQRVTLSEFYPLAEASSERLELVDGEIIVMPPPVPLHQSVIFNTGIMIRLLGVGGKIYLSPIEVEFDAKNALQPDLLWIAPGGQCTIGDKQLYGAPDLIIAVFSPRTTHYDKKEKFALYERFGVQEYWMIDAVEQYGEVHTLTGGKYSRLGVFGSGDTFISGVLNQGIIVVSQIFE